MHEQVVGGVGFLTFDLGNASCHRYGRYACRADEGVDLAAGQLIHQLAHQQTAHGGQSKRGQTENDDLDGLKGQKALSAHGSTDSQTQHNGDDIHQRILCGVAQTVGNAAFTEQVTQHQAADQRSGGGQQQDADGSDQDGEYDLLLLGYGASLLHLDAALFFGGQQLHYGRLDERNKRHIGVCGDSYGAQICRGKLGGQINSGGAVSAADNTDSCGNVACKAQQNSAEECNENTHLCCSAHQHAGGAGKHGAKVGHSTDAQEDDGGVDTGFDTDVEDIQQTAVVNNIGKGDMLNDLTGCGDYVGCARDISVPHLLMEHIAAGQITQQTAECDTDHQQGLELFADAQIEQHEADNYHYQKLPAALCKKRSYARLKGKLLQGSKNIHSLRPLMPGLQEQRLCLLLRPWMQRSERLRRRGVRRSRFPSSWPRG